MTDGEKLRKIREKYKLKQSDVAGNDVTRNLLSEIETGKAVITKNTAEVIIKNLKEFGKKHNFKVDETVEYLMENTLVQATKILDDYIAKLKKLLITKGEDFAGTLKEAKSFLADWDINDKMASIYELAGDYYYINNDMYESIMYYEKALTAIGKLVPSDELLQVFFKITKAYMHAGNYDKAVENYTFVIDHFDNLSSKYIVNFMYNRAYSYSLLNKYELAIRDINKIEDLVDKDDIQKYFKVFDTKAICLKEIKRYDEAINLYRSVLNILNDEQINKKIALHINITEAYMALNNLDKVNSEFSIVQKELPYLDNNSEYEEDIYFEVGRIYEYLKSLEEASKYYNKAKDIANKKKNYVLLNMVLYKLINIATNNEKVDLIKNEVFKLSTKQDKLMNNLIHKLIDFYINNNNITKIKEINDFALQFN